MATPLLLKEFLEKEFLPELMELLGKAVPAGSGRVGQVPLSHEELDNVLRAAEERLQFEDEPSTFLRALHALGGKHG